MILLYRDGSCIFVNNFLTVNNRKVKLLIFLRYTYGQPLKGVVLISIKYNSYYHTRGNTPTITKTIKVYF